MIDLIQQAWNNDAVMMPIVGALIGLNVYVIIEAILTSR